MPRVRCAPRTCICAAQLVHIAALGVDLRQQPQLSWFRRLGRLAGDDLGSMFGMCSVPEVTLIKTKISHGKQPRHFVGGLELPVDRI